MKEICSREGMTCPYCGHVHHITDFYDQSYYGYGIFDCVECHQTFTSACNKIYSWTTKRYDENEENIEIKSKK